MFKDRRGSPRHNFNRYARIQLEGTGGTRDCLIVNMGEDGVRLHTESADIPAEFTLMIADAVRPRRSCRVMWRLGCEIGVQFTDGGQNAAHQRAAATA
jgi:hypothetical protein